MMGFGGPDERKRYNEKLFTIVAPKYDVATRLLSFGQDARWKRILIDGLPVITAPRCLDIACGSGDLTAALSEKYPDGQVLGVDLTPAMIEKAQAKNARPNVEYRVEDMCALPAVLTNNVDIVTGGYALRNAQELPGMIAEVSRVLKDGGLAAFLEFANAENRLMRSVHQAGLNAWGGLCGLILHGDSAVYRYIPRTLKTFPGRRELARIMQAAGIDLVRNQRFFMGVIEISLWRKRGRRRPAANSRSELVGFH